MTNSIAPKIKTNVLITGKQGSVYGYTQTIRLYRLVFSNTHKPTLSNVDKMYLSGYSMHSLCLYRNVGLVKEAWY